MKYLTGLAYRIDEPNVGVTFFIECIALSAETPHSGRNNQITGIDAQYIQITNDEISLGKFDLFHFIEHIHTQYEKYLTTKL